MICAGADATPACPDSPEKGSFLRGSGTQCCTGRDTSGLFLLLEKGPPLYDGSLLPGDEKGEQVFSWNETGRRLRISAREEGRACRRRTEGPELPLARGKNCG